MKKQSKIIISGGGTGGHIFPAIAIANALKEQLPNAEILFVGAEGKMEMERVPKAGYKIVGLPIRGFQRNKPASFLATVVRLMKSLKQAKKIIKKFQPDVAVGVGGYASAAVLYKAAKMNIPTLIQEQNSYPGMTNNLLAAKAKKICVAYDKMERFFPKEKIVFAGNPIRQDLLLHNTQRAEAVEYYKLQSDKKTILCVGGSLGARTLNDSLLDGLQLLAARKDIQIIWQTGAYYYEKIKESVGDSCPSNVHIHKFLDRMDYAYAAADLVVSRAGAISISELSALNKAVILVPSPNVAEDHQTKNALALVEKDAAVMVKDAEATPKLLSTMFAMIDDDAKLQKLREHIGHFARKDAAANIAKEVIALMK